VMSTCMDGGRSAGRRSATRARVTSFPVAMHAADIERVVERVLGEVAAAGGRSPARCACHGRLDAWCPAKAGLESAEASRARAQTARVTPSGIAALIDHTRLNADATRAEVEALCAEAATHRFAAVCVNPVWVPACVQALRGTGIPVCTVVGFPLGATTPDTKAYEARQAIVAGAREIDMVIHIGALRSGMLRAVEEDIEAVTAVCRELGALRKVIIEAALLEDEEKVAACTLARLAGADYVKTSTGFGPGGATASDVALMRAVVGPAMGVKASGGVRDLTALRAMVTAGATRIGTSAGVRIMREMNAAGSSEAGGAA
jgi:deoxyribose-phosphate aldolase